MVIRPALSNATRDVIAGIADIYGYAHEVTAGEMSVLTLRCTDGSIECGCRFKYIPEQITTNYQELVDAIQGAIDKEAAEHDNKYVTNERIAPTVTVSYDFDALMKEFTELVSELMSENQSNALKITSIAEKYLGKGKKVGDCTPEQAEQLDLIVSDLKELKN